MTKVIILGQQETEPKKKIEFVKFLGIDLKTYDATRLPNDYDNIELVCRNYRGTGYDLFFAYNDDRNKGISYLGQFNDGVV